MTTEKAIIKEAISRLINRHKKEYQKILLRIRKEVRGCGGILK